MKKYIIQIIILILAISITSIYYEIKLKEIKKQSYWEGVTKQFEEERYLDEKEKQANSCFNISNNDEINKLLKTHFKDCNTAKIMWAIAQAESKGNIDAVNSKNRNRSWDCGLFQNNTIHRKKGQSKEDFCKEQKNLYTNFKTAESILKKQGFEGWATFNNKKYLTYLK